MAVSTSSRALLLKRSPYGETSLVVQVLTRDHGLVSLLARGAYRPTSRFFAVLDLFDTLELEWRPRRSSDLALLVSGDRRVLRRSIPRDLEAYRAGLAALEAGQFGGRAGARDHELYDLLESTLDRLDAAPVRADLELIVFDLRFLASQGLAPALEACAACGRPAPVPHDPREKTAFSAERGGRLCRHCALAARAEGARVGLLPAQVLVAAALMGREGADALRDRGLESLRAAVRDFVERFLEYHLERRPKARRRLPRPRRRSGALAAPTADDHAERSHDLPPS
ncbi:DNA repair protein RecO [Engelhardtia mirabilis]|uniref:DNA repair protein RecO n=1 Tax=Engelhardtia mirabilis TaxID=2528011 RepID=A0A518BNG4_9BACT|nr:DNA repair protein RecO [Planctomycetes bacterium Pla133]QDV02840.1 DNA repair protein RecO [Planctomycetes bacterium Pla86]